MDIKDIKINPIRDSGGKPVGWEMTYDNKKGDKPGSYPEVVLLKDSGNHEFTITIENANGIAFAHGTNYWKNGDNALWIHEGLTSPTQKVTHAQIKDVKLHNNTQLIFKDINNGKEVTLAYQLNFTGAPPLDPIIQNGGGTGPGVPIQEYALYGFAIVFVAALLGYILLRNKRMKASPANEANIRDENG